MSRAFLLIQKFSNSFSEMPFVNLSKNDGTSRVLLLKKPCGNALLFEAFKMSYFFVDCKILQIACNVLRFVLFIQTTNGLFSASNKNLKNLALETGG